jgi:hypothetical protein
MSSEFNFPEAPKRVEKAPRVFNAIPQTSKSKASLILGGFGLQFVKSALYPFTEGEKDDYAPVSTSYLGTPVFSNLTFPAGSYKNLQGEQIDFEELQIDTVLFDVSMAKNIVKTEIQGRNGTVKEYISDGDYQVVIRGLIASESSDKYPDEEVKKLVEILKVQKDLAVESRFLNDVFDISNIVIESYSLPQAEGFQNIQGFEITAISDDPIELTIRTK